jgi:hypothetical protein
VVACGGSPLALLLAKGAVRSRASGVGWAVRVLDGVGVGGSGWLTVHLVAARGVRKFELDHRSGVYAPSLDQVESLLLRAMQHNLHGVPTAGGGMFLDAACILAGRPEADALVAWRQWLGGDACDLRELLKRRHLVPAGARHAALDRPQGRAGRGEPPHGAPCQQVLGAGRRDRRARP